MDKSNMISNDDVIINYINRNQGCHLRELKKDLRLSMGSVQYYLDKLEKDGKITSIRSGLYKYHFSIGTETKEISLIQVLKHNTPREILFYILNNKNPTQIEIAFYLDISQPTVHWHLKKLIELGIIEEVRDKKFKRYIIINQKDYYVTIYKIFKSQHNSIWNKWSERLAEVFSTIAGENEKLR